MALPNEFLEQIRSANRIDDVVSSYATLKSAGRIKKCCCPFHSEKTPSCVIYPDTESFYCFGCGVGGDVITFIMNIEHLSYIEAVRLLAQRSGLPMPEDSNKDDKYTYQKKRLYEMNKAAGRFFYNNLNTEKGRLGRDYLLKRGLKPETITKFGLGVATNSWNDLKYHLMSEGFTEQELIDGSLITRSSKSNQTFDFFKNRAMFPIFDIRGNVIAFSGRDLSGEDSRKYLNTKETLVYKKTRTLFCMNFAKNLAAKKKQLILCEGNLDVISLHQAGFENAVATCGTAITPEHARLISQYCDEVALCYDSDDAGQKATQKAIGILSDVGLKTKVIKIQGAKDPDEFIQKFGGVAFQKLIDRSQGAISFELAKCKDGIDEQTEQGKIDILNKSASVVANIKNPIERDVYASKLANEYGVSKESVLQEVESIIKSRARAQKKREWQKAASFSDGRRDALNPMENTHRREVKAEKGILSYLFFNPDKAKNISQKLLPEAFISEINKKIYISLLKKIENGENISISSFHDEFNSEEMGKISEIIALSKGEITIGYETVMDYIDTLINFKANNKEENSEISDDDFLKFAQNMRNKK